VPPKSDSKRLDAIGRVTRSTKVSYYLLNALEVLILINIQDDHWIVSPTASFSPQHHVFQDDEFTKPKNGLKA
jgi:hypothetical protein